MEESRERIALSRRWRRCGVKMPSVMDRGLRFFRAFRLDKLDCFRADERTRTAHLLITSDQSPVAGGCLGLQIPHI